MLPSTLFRKVIYLAFIVELMILSGWMANFFDGDPGIKPLVATLLDLSVALLIWASAPLFAKYWLAPPELVDQNVQRLVSVQARAAGCTVPVHVIKSSEPYAGTLGITEFTSQIYVTTGLVQQLSPVALLFVLAHEATHAAEQHILTLFAFVSCSVFISLIVGQWWFFSFAMLAFLMFRRYLEFRADRGAAQAIGIDAALIGLQQLEAISPTKKLERYIAWALPYPTLKMRHRAVQSKVVSLI